MNSSNIKELAVLLQKLREVDNNHWMFGSDSHLYQLGRTLTEEELCVFEQDNGVRLPEDYRAFLKEVGNGGAGPFYGLETLTESAYRDLSRPFPLTKSTELYSQEELDALPDSDEYPGVLEFCHQGCAMYFYLVVNGPGYGTIWEGQGDFYPTGMTFGEWYRNWLEKALRTLVNEPLIGKLSVGMTKEQVVAAVPLDWKERESQFSPKYYFGAPEFPAQLELDQQRRVTKINRFPFVVGRPSLER